MRARLLIIGIATLLVVGCAAPGPPGPVGEPPTPGCPNTSWDSYRGMTDLAVPPGLTITSSATSRTGVTVRNTATKPWTVLVVWWSNMMCFGWSGTEGTYATIVAGSAQDLAVKDPGLGAMESRIGVEFWDHAPDQASPGPAAGFGWVEVPQPSASN